MSWLPIETVTPPASEPVLIGQVRDYLRIATNDQDATLLGLTIAARNHVETVTGLRLMPQTVRLRRAGFAEVMRLPVAPVQSIVSVEYLDADGVEQALDASNYQAILAGREALIRRAPGGSWPAVHDSPQAVSITAVAGFAGINEVPEAIRLALLMLIDHFEARADTEIPPQIDTLLFNHKLHRFG